MGGYHRRELPQVSFLSRHTRVCRDKTRLLSRQMYACSDKITFVATTYFYRDKTFVTTNICLSRQKLHLWQLPPMIMSCHKYHFCRDKHKSMLATTKRSSGLKVLSQQAYFCRDKRRVCREKTRLLSRQK